jgi:CheY-like chemotaxis protein
MNRPSILCVDDYETSLAGWCLYLQNEGYSVTTARTAQEGLERFAVSPVELVLLEYAMPESNGGDVAATMKRIQAGCPYSDAFRNAGCPRESATPQRQIANRSPRQDPRATRQAHQSRLI